MLQYVDISKGEYDVWANEWYKCPSCEYKSLDIGFNYCPSCGEPLSFNNEEAEVSKV